MEQIRNFEWAQGRINEMLQQSSDERHSVQQQHIAGENRAQRRERERNERRAAKRTPKVRA